MPTSHRYRIRMAEVMLLMAVVLLPLISTTYIDNFYDRVFRGNLSEWDRRELQQICGKHNLTDTLTSIQPRSLGGIPVKDVEYPWVLALLNAEWTKICSAVLISRRHVLTAAHCVTTYKKRQAKLNCSYTVWKESMIYIYPRSSVNDVMNIRMNTGSYSVVKVSVHPNFDPCNLTADIALLEISPNMLTEASPICMPRSNEEVVENLTSAGFGFNPRIRGGQPMQIVNLKYGWTTNEDTIVTYTPGKTICQGDSGGPLFKRNGTRYVLLGITSSFQKCISANYNLKSWFEDVRKKLAWICQMSGVCPE